MSTAKTPKKGVPSKGELLNATDRLPYKKRIQMAATIGAANKNTPQLQNLISQLREHAEVAPPVFDDEKKGKKDGDKKDEEDNEDPSKLFPNEQRNMAFFHEDQLALAAAIGGKEVTPLIEELKSPSLFFKKKVITQIVGLENDMSNLPLFPDDIVGQYVREAVPTVRRRLITSLLRFKRTKVLESLVKWTETQYGVAEVARFLHGCSDDTMHQYLSRVEYKDSPAVRWHKLATSHGPVILRLMRADLSKASGSVEVSQQWSKWDSRFARGKADGVLLHRGNQSLELLRLALDYPNYSTNSHTAGSFAPFTLDKKMPLYEQITKLRARRSAGEVISVPGIVRNNLPHLLRRHPTEMNAFIQYMIFFGNGSTGVDYGLEPQALWSLKKRLPEEFLGHFVSILRVVFAEAPAHVLLHGTMDYPVRAFTRNSLTNFPSKIGELTDILLKFIEVRRPSEEKEHANHGVAASVHSTWVNTADTTYSAIRNDIMNIFKMYEIKLVAAQYDVSSGWLSIDFQREDHQRASISRAAVFRKMLVKVMEHRASMVTQHWRHRSVDDATWRRTTLQLLKATNEQFSSFYDHYHALPPEEYVFQQKLFPFLDKGQVFEPVERTVSWNSWSSAVSEYVSAVLARYHAFALNASNQQDKSTALQRASELFRYFLPRYKSHRIAVFSTMISWLPLLESKDRLELFNAFTLEDFKALVLAQSETVLKLLTDIAEIRDGEGAAVVPTGLQVIQPCVRELLQPDATDQVTRDRLLALQLIDNTTWKAMVKATDSNSALQRSEGYRVMIESTLKLRSPPQLVKTLKHITAKIKNESALNRADAIDRLLGKINSDEALGRFKRLDQAEIDSLLQIQSEGAFMLHSSALPLYSEMLTDALESQDLDLHQEDVEKEDQKPDFPFFIPDVIVFLTIPGETEMSKADRMAAIDTAKRKYESQTRNHYILGNFYRLSIFAIRRSCAEPESALFNFAVDLQWKIALFRLGERPAAEQFRIDVGLALPNRRLPQQDEPSITICRVRTPADLPEPRDLLPLPEKEPVHKKQQEQKSQPKKQNKRKQPPSGKTQEKEKKQKDEDTKMSPADDQKPTSVALESRFVTGFLKAYEQRVTQRNPEYLVSAEGAAKYLEVLFRITGKAALHVQQLAAFARKALDSIKAAEKDFEGIYVIDGDHFAIRIFEFLLELYGKKWATVPILVEFVETLMHSRQARRVFWTWYHWKLDQGRTRDDIVIELLQISPSSIYIRFVWRHLITYRQDLADKFINPENTFKGVFYLNPDNRGKLLEKPKKVVTAAPKKRGRGHAAAPSRRKTKPVNPRYDWWKGLTNADMKAQLKEEAKLDALIEKERLELGRRDFREYFTFPACFGLHRLLPRQLYLLGLQHCRAALNPDRGTPERVKGAILWSLLPTTMYTDVIKFSEHADTYSPEATLGLPVPEVPPPKVKKPVAEAKPTGEAKAEDESKEEGKKKKGKGGKANKKEGVSTNLSEALIKGVMQNDNRLLPLRYLLQPKFLSSQEARVAIYACGACLPHVGPALFSRILQFVLTGKRRHALKITAYKEAMRLVSANKSTKNLNMILHEWKRDILHRDVRIAILQIAIRFLSVNNERGPEVGWEILESATKNTDPEILTALLGAKPGHLGTKLAVSLFNPEGLTNNPRLADHVKEMTKCVVPTASCGRYLEKILSKLCETKIDDDVKHLAISCLADWTQYGNANQIAALWSGILVSADSKTLLDPRAKTQEVNDNRYTDAKIKLLKICKVTSEWDGLVEPTVAVDVVEKLGKLALNTPERSARAALFRRMKEFLDGWPNSARNYGLLSPVLEHKLEPKGLFWPMMLTRKNASNTHNLYNELDALAFCKTALEFIRGGVNDVLTRTTAHLQYFLSEVRALFDRVSSYYAFYTTWGVHSILRELLVDLFSAAALVKDLSKETTDALTAAAANLRADKSTLVSLVDTVASLVSGTTKFDAKADSELLMPYVQVMIHVVTVILHRGRSLSGQTTSSADSKARWVGLAPHLAAFYQFVLGLVANGQWSGPSDVETNSSMTFELEWLGQYVPLTIRSRAKVKAPAAPAPRGGRSGRAAADASKANTTTAEFDKTSIIGVKEFSHAVNDLSRILSALLSTVGYGSHCGVDEVTAPIIELLVQNVVNSKPEKRNLSLVSSQILLGFAYNFPKLLASRLQSVPQYVYLISSWVDVVASRDRCFQFASPTDSFLWDASDVPEMTAANDIRSHVTIATQLLLEAACDPVHQYKVDNQPTVANARHTSDVPANVIELISGLLLPARADNVSLFHFELALHVFEKFPTFSIQEPGVAIRFARVCLARCLLYPRTTTSVRSRVTNALVAGFEEKFKELLTAATLLWQSIPEEKRPVNPDVSQPAWNNRVASFERFLKEFLASPETPSKGKKVQESKESTQPTAFIPAREWERLPMTAAFRQFTAIVGIDMLQSIGVQTKVKVAPAEKETKATKPKTAAMEVDDGAGAPKPEKKTAPNRVSWRPEFESLLALFAPLAKDDPVVFRAWHWLVTSEPIQGTKKDAEEGDLTVLIITRIQATRKLHSGSRERCGKPE